MTKETLLMQYQSEYYTVLKPVINISKSFEKIFMDTMKLFMAILNRINFLQLGISLFENETFDWFVFNDSILSVNTLPTKKLSPTMNT